MGRLARRDRLLALMSEPSFEIALPIFNSRFVALDSKETEVSKETWGYIIWGAWFALFAVPEVLAMFGTLVPWPTLSTTSWNLQKVSSWFSILILAGLTVLTIHIVFHWPGPAHPPEVPPQQPEPPVLP